MVLIVGGKAQGKRSFAEACQKQKQKEKAAPQALTGQKQEGPQIWDALQDKVEAWLKAMPFAQKEDPETLARSFRETVLQSASEEDILICEETGCGIVPLDGAERLRRDVTGHLCCLLAREAEEVYRVWCGLPQKLK